MAKLNKEKAPKAELDLSDVRTIVGMDLSWTGLAMCAMAARAGSHKPISECVIATKPGDYESQQERLHELLRRVEAEMDAASGMRPIGEGVLAVIEGYAMGSKTRPQMAGELAGAVKLLLWRLGIPMLVVPPTVLKKHVMGKGVGAKEQMMLQAFKRWQYESQDNNACDAYCLAQMGRHAVQGGHTKGFVELMGKCEVVPVRARMVELELGSNGLRIVPA